MDPRVAGRTARRIETLHALSYFAADVEGELTALGLRAGRMSYFAQRAAPMGPVGGGTVAATFYVFNPSLVHHFVPACWGLASPADVTAARYRGVTAAYTRLLGADTLASPEVAEAADLARNGGCRVHGRGPAAVRRARRPGLADGAAPGAVPRAHAAARAPRGRPRRGAPLGRAERARGPGVALGDRARLHRPRGPSHPGRSEDEWAAAVAVLAERGVLTPDGALTDEGAALRTSVERATEVLAGAPWDALGADGTARLEALCLPLVPRAVEGGAFPAGVFG